MFDNDDDSATLVVEMDKEAITAMAKIGLVKVLMDEANRTLIENETPT